MTERKLTDGEFVERCREASSFDDRALISVEAGMVKRLIRIIDELQPKQAGRCGSFPFRYMAEDFGLPYGVVLNYSEVVSKGFSTTPQHRDACVAIADRLSQEETQRLHRAVRLQLMAIK